MTGAREFVAFDLECPVDAIAQLLDTLGVDIEAYDSTLFSEFDGKWQTHVAKADKRYITFDSVSGHNTIR